MIRAWLPEAYQAARKMWADGRSGGEIAKAIHASRSAVMGVIHRNRDDFPPRGGVNRSYRPRRAAPKPAKPSEPVVEPVAAHAHPIPVAPDASALDVDVKAIVPMTFIRAATEERCLFYAGDAYGPSGPDMLVCGCRRAENRLRKPYCAAHLAIEIEKRSAA